MAILCHFGRIEKLIRGTNSPQLLLKQVSVSDESEESDFGQEQMEYMTQNNSHIRFLKSGQKSLQQINIQILIETTKTLSIIGTIM